MRDEKIFVTKSGPDAVREGVPYIERDAVVVIVKHWSEDKYLCSVWKKTHWIGFVIGGIEKGEKIKDTAIREVIEETGFQNLEFVAEVSGVVHSKFYHPIKNVNRFAHFRVVVLKLVDNKRNSVSDEEDAIHDVVWIKKEDVADFINADDMKEIWKRSQTIL